MPADPGPGSKPVAIVPFRLDTVDTTDTLCGYGSCVVEFESRRPDRRNMANSSKNVEQDPQLGNDQVARTERERYLTRDECERCGSDLDSIARPGECCSEICRGPMVSVKYVPADDAGIERAARRLARAFGEEVGFADWRRVAETALRGAGKGA